MKLTAMEEAAIETDLKMVRMMGYADDKDDPSQGHLL